MANGGDQDKLRYELADPTRKGATDEYLRSDAELDKAFGGPYPATSKQYKRRMQRAHKAWNRAKAWEAAGERMNKSASRRAAQRDEKRSR